MTSAPLRAIEIADKDEFERLKLPGSFRLVPRSSPDEFEFEYFSPIGSGIKGRLLVGLNHKPSGPRPSWSWNGSRSEPDLKPSVNEVGLWHGWLRNGYWELCG